MLVLSRHEGEGITIGDIVITVKKIKGSIVKLSIDAPKDVRIKRTETCLPEDFSEAEPTVEAK